MKIPIYAVILAGGSGSRFWPLSRRRSPKQVLQLLGKKSLVAATADRLIGLVDYKDIFIATNRQQAKLIGEHLPDLPPDNFIIEPVPRNTAPCVGLSALYLRRLNPDAVMVMLPSDHLIQNEPRFRDCLKRGVEVAKEKDAIVTIGIPPTRPETGYGYIQMDCTAQGLPLSVCRVKTFAEKPNYSTAQRFVEAGDFYWNSGIFIWSVRRIISEMEEYLPEQFSQLRAIDQVWGGKNYTRVASSRYSRIRPISIDYGIMEVTATPIYMLKGDFGWSDVGSWDELFRISEKGRDGNVLIGETVGVDARNNYIYSPGKVTAVIGLENFLVVNTSDATLICPLDRAQDVKQVVEKLQKDGRKRHT